MVYRESPPLSSTLGVIGGMGSVAAASLFSRLVELQSVESDQDYIEVFLHNNSRVPDRTEGILHGAASPLPELLRSVEICNRVGVDFLILACMTSHYFIPELQKQSRAVILDGISETVSEVTRSLPATRRIGVLASTGLIKCGLFQKAFRDVGIEPLVFNEVEQNHFFMEPIYEPWGIKAGHVSGEPKERFLSAVRRFRELGADAVVGGCSEIPLVLADGEADLPLVNSMDCLCRAAIDRCLAATPTVTTDA